MFLKQIRGIRSPNLTNVRFHWQQSVAILRWYHFRNAPPYCHTSLSLFRPARRYASAGTSYGPVFVSAFGVLNDYALYKSTHSPCQSQVGVLSKRIEPVFWHESFLPPVLHCVKRKFGHLQNKGSSIWNFVPNFGLRKFYTALFHHKMVAKNRTETWRNET